MLLAEFDTAEAAARALAWLRAHGVRRVETYGPFPLTHQDAHAPSGSLLLSFLSFAAGLFGFIVGYGIQWYVNAVLYPLNIGGRPAHAAPAFLPVAFETTVLCAALAVCVGFVVAERLPRLWQPLFEIDGFERAAIDRFWIAVDLRDLASPPEPLVRELAPMRPLRIVMSEGPV